MWFVYDDTWRSDEPHLSEYTLNVMKEYDRFAYLECKKFVRDFSFSSHFF